MSSLATPRRPAGPRRPARPLASALMAFEAVTLAAFATLHLSGVLQVGSSSRPSYGAGVAEALICLALAGGAVANRRRAALAAVVFAIFGFLVGLSFTIGGGDPIDLGYHLLMLPVLVATATVIARRPCAPAVPRPRSL